MQTQKNYWTQDEDLILAETVLRHVREGSKFENAFEEVSIKLSRTSQASCYRWHNFIKSNYTQALKLAKKERSKLLKKTTNINKTPNQQEFVTMMPVIEETATNEITVVNLPKDDITYENVINFLNNQKNEDVQLSLENTQLKEENEKLKSQLTYFKKIETQYNEIVKLVDKVSKQF